MMQIVTNKALGLGLRMQSSLCRRLIRPVHHAVPKDSPALFSFSGRGFSNHGATNSYKQSSKIPMLSNINWRGIIYHPTRRSLFSTSKLSDMPPGEPEKVKRGQRVWKARKEIDVIEGTVNNDNVSVASRAEDHWDTAVDDVNDRRDVDESLSRICEQVCESYCCFIVISYFVKRSAY